MKINKDLLTYEWAESLDDDRVIQGSAIGGYDYYLTVPKELRRPLIELQHRLVHLTRKFRETQTEYEEAKQILASLSVLFNEGEDSDDDK